MRSSRARSTVPAASCHVRSSVGFITNTFECEFLVHTRSARSSLLGFRRFGQAINTHEVFGTYKLELHHCEEQLRLSQREHARPWSADMDAQVEDIRALL